MVVEGAEQRVECHAQQGVFGSEGWMVSGSALRRGKKCELGIIVGTKIYLLAKGFLLITVNKFLLFYGVTMFAWCLSGN